MGELRQEFLKQTIFNLKNLQPESFEKETFSEDFLRQFFRQLHTIKGTSRTFNLNHLSRLAHEIENLLQAVQNKKIEQNFETNELFAESFKQLLQISENYQSNLEIVYPQNFTDKIKNLIPDSVANYSTDSIPSQIPSQIWSKLAEQEKMNLNNAVQAGKIFYPFKVSFALATFYEDFKQCKEILNNNGEAIAVAPSETGKPLEEIAFQIIYVSLFSKVEIEKLVKPFVITIEFLTENYAENLSGVLSRLIENCEKNAHKLNKQILFKKSHDNSEITPQNLVLLNQIASHLLNNAIDHAIESVEERTKHGKNPTAKIEIVVATVENKLFLQIKDDGKGIDIEKIISHAKQNNLIAQDQVLSEQKTLELIFLQGFSTSQTVSEISGRGVGLDAVKDLVENAGGKIEVETKVGKGTIFSVYLPNG